MKMRVKLFLFFLLVGFNASSQNLTGTWEGVSSAEYCKLVILQINDSCFGFTYDEGFGHCKANYVGSYDQSSKNLFGLNTSFIDRNILHTLSIYDLIYSEQNGVEYLRGRIKPKTTGAMIMSMGIPQGIWYKKVSENVDTTKLMAAKIKYYQSQVVENKVEEKEIEKPTIKIPDTIQIQKIVPVPDLNAVKDSRTSTLVKTLETAADSIRLVLYDNGEIDGDTVTVFYNGVIVFNSVPLSVKPLEITLAVNKTNTVNSIELMANNLGSIPPNTALLLIFAGKERHELRVSSDYSTNAQIDIIHRQP
jgi:hypothetical protein